MGTQADYSTRSAAEIDDEVRKLIEAAHTEAWEVLTEYRDVLDTLAGELLEKETLHRAELQAIFAEVEEAARGSPCSTTSAAACRPTSRRSRRRASWRSSAASRGPSRCPSRRSRPRSPQASQAAAERRPDQNGSNGARQPTELPRTARRSPTTAPRPAGTRRAGRRSGSSHRPAAPAAGPLVPAAATVGLAASPTRRISPIRSPDIQPPHGGPHQRRRRTRTRARTSSRPNPPAHG